VAKKLLLGRWQLLQKTRREVWEFVRLNTSGIGAEEYSSIVAEGRIGSEEASVHACRVALFDRIVGG